MQVYGIFCHNSGIKYLVFLNFRYSVHRHELNAYFSVEAALLAG